MELNPEKLKRIEAVLVRSDFKTVKEFVNHAVEMLLFAEENRDKFNKMLGPE
jgi:hypothetical protein